MEAEVILQLCYLRPCLRDIQEKQGFGWLFSQFSQACACELAAALWPPFPLLLLTEEMELEMDESLVRDNLIYSHDFLKPVESCLFV